MSGNQETHVISSGGNTSGSRVPHIGRVTLLIIVVIVVGAGAYWYYSSHRKKDTGVSASTQKTIDSAVTKSVQNPDYAAAKAALNDQLKTTTDNKKRATLYVSLASIALQQGKSQDVVDNELRAIQADPSLEGAQSRTIADAYEKLGNKSEALKYYQKSLDYYKSQPDTFSGRDYFISSIQSKITELSK
jgi:tetratricopeptide (TPR) repeat protein